MDEKSEAFIEVEFSKINFLLENLYALVLRELGANHEDVPRLAEEICRQATLPATVYGAETSEEQLAALQELSSHRLAMFFARVRDRLRSDQQPE